MQLREMIDKYPQQYIAVAYTKKGIDNLSEINTDEYGNTYMETDESVDLVQNVRRPYYRMRGVPVTREQAFDIIWI